MAYVVLPYPMVNCTRAGVVGMALLLKGCRNRAAGTAQSRLLMNSMFSVDRVFTNSRDVWFSAIARSGLLANREFCTCRNSAATALPEQRNRDYWCL
jgi:hypothetical protein